MTMHINVGEVKYAPSRDIVYLLPDVIRNVADRLEDGKYKPLHDWLTSRGVSLDDLGHGVRCYIEFLATSTKDSHETMWGVLSRSGWNDCRWEVQVAVMYYCGVLMTGTFFRGVRDVTPLGGRPPAPIHELVHAARQLDAYLSWSPVTRWFASKWRWVRRLLLRGRGVYTEV